MYYILYNPYSSNGKGIEFAKKLANDLKKENKEYIIEDLVKLSHDAKGFLATIDKKDSIVIIGGDGTLHRFVNGVRGLSFENQIYLYKAGTGNDFSREFKGQKLIHLNEYIKNLPSVSVNDLEDELFLNCSGFGVDGEVCQLVNKNSNHKKGIQYFKDALKVFKNFKRYNLEVYVDGIRHIYKKVIFTTVMNGKYFGGGMKLSPTSNRSDDLLEVYVIHSLPLWKLILIFPLIFIGKHMKFKSLGISTIVGKKIDAFASEKLVFQTDGEVKEEVSKFSIKL